MSKNEVADFTGYVSAAAQICYLKENNIKFFLSGSGEPIIDRKTHKEELASDRPRARPIKPKTHYIQGKEGARFKVKECGIYLLMLKSEIVYVGKTENFFCRMTAHQATEKRFDSIVFIKAAPEMLNAYEAEHIAKYKPMYNIALTGKKRSAKSVPHNTSH